MDIRPLGDRVVVEREKEDDTTPGGIIIPENAKEPLTRGRVVATGPGALVDGKRREPELKRGDRVIFGKYAGTELDRDGRELLVMREDDILAVLGEE